MPCQAALRFAKAGALMLAFASPCPAASSAEQSHADLPIQTTLTHLQLQIGGTTGCQPNQSWSEAAGGCATTSPSQPDPPPASAPAVISYTCRILSTSGYTGQGRSASSIRPSGNPLLEADVTVRTNTPSDAPGADIHSAVMARGCTQTLRLETSSCKSETFERTVQLSAGSPVIAPTSRRTGSLWELKGTLRPRDSELAGRTSWVHKSTQDECPPRPGDPPIGYVYTFQAGLICGSADSGYSYTPSRSGSHCVTNSVRNAIIQAYRSHGYGRCPESTGYRYWLDDVALVAAQTGGAQQCETGLSKALQNIRTAIQQEDGSWNCQSEADRRWPPAGSVLAVMVPGTGRDCRVTAYR